MIVCRGFRNNNRGIRGFPLVTHYIQCSSIQAAHYHDHSTMSQARTALDNENYQTEERVYEKVDNNRTQNAGDVIIISGYDGVLLT